MKFPCRVKVFNDIGHSYAMKTRLICLLPFVSAIAACSGGGNETPPMELNLDGEYNVSAPSTTDFASDGGVCGDASGTLTITDGVLEGAALSTGGLSYEISGEVGSDGSVAGGFAISGQNAASFEGTFDETSGSGTWVDIVECSGTWEANRIVTE